MTLIAAYKRNGQINILADGRIISGDGKETPLTETQVKLFDIGSSEIGKTVLGLAGMTTVNVHNTDLEINIYEHINNVINSNSNITFKAFMENFRKSMQPYFEKIQPDHFPKQHDLLFFAFTSDTDLASVAWSYKYLENEFIPFAISSSNLKFMDGKTVLFTSQVESLDGNCLSQFWSMWKDLITREDSKHEDFVEAFNSIVKCRNAKGDIGELYMTRTIDY